MDGGRKCVQCVRLLALMSDSHLKKWEEQFAKAAEPGEVVNMGAGAYTRGTENSMPILKVVRTGV